MTGSAHCALTSYWSAEFDTTSLVGKQSSKRGGYVYCEIDKSNTDRVSFKGLTKSVVNGELFL